MSRQVAIAAPMLSVTTVLASPSPQTAATLPRQGVSLVRLTW